VGERQHDGGAPPYAQRSGAPPLPPRVARPRRGGAEEVISAADVLPVLEPTPHEEQLHSPRGSDDPPVLSHT
jgi:hypothetical protein